MMAFLRKVFACKSNKRDEDFKVKLFLKYIIRLRKSKNPTVLTMTNFNQSLAIKKNVMI
jgi:hypothetical protein